MANVWSWIRNLKTRHLMIKIKKYSEEASVPLPIEGDNPSRTPALSPLQYEFASGAPNICS